MIDFGLSPEIFRSRFFESEPVHLPRCVDASRFGWQTVDRALDLQDPTRELLKVLKGGRVDPSSYVEEYVDIGIRRRRIRKDRLYELLADGATIVLNRMELVSNEVRDVCSEVGRFVGTQTSANVYACLGGEPATNVHWDTHDVFVVQVKGRKNWTLYEPTHPLPISSQTSNDHKAEVPARPWGELVLETGDALYVPRGWWHRVAPVEGHDTIHLTIALHAPLILDYVVWACGSVLPDQLQFRHSLLGGERDLGRVAEAVAAMASALRDPRTIDLFYERAAARDRVVAPFAISTLLQDGADGVDPDATVMLNARWSPGRSRWKTINGQKLSLGALEDRVVQAVGSTVRTTVARLADDLANVPYDEVRRTIRDLARADILQLS